MGNEDLKTRLVICKAHIPEAALGKGGTQYWMVSSGDELDRHFSQISTCFAEIFVERSLVESSEIVLKAIEESNVREIADFVEKRQFNYDLKLGVLVSSDTQASYLSKIADYFRKVIFVIPSRRSKDDGAARELDRAGLKFVELEYGATEHAEIIDFAPDLFLVASDWTSEFLALKRVLGTGVPVIALQEGPHDYQTRFKQEIRGEFVYKENRQYRCSDVLFSQGAPTLYYTRPKYFCLTGNPKINLENWNPSETCERALVNQNFTYAATKPNYESRGMKWMSEVTESLNEVGMSYFVSKHPRDELPSDYGDTLESNALIVSDQIASCDVVISRLSSIIYEAMAQGKQAIYYNGNDEFAYVFHMARGGGIWIARDKSELVGVLNSLKAGRLKTTESLNGFLQEHCCVGDSSAAGIRNVASVLYRMGASRTNGSDLGDLLGGGLCTSRIRSEPNPEAKVIAIVGKNGRDGYSGGRYHSWMQALALVRAGYRTYYVTDEVPTFVMDFRRLREFQELRIVISRNFDEVLIEKKVDAVIVVPGMDTDDRPYAWARTCSEKWGSKLVLLNFESPNWFNLTSPVKRDEALWMKWNEFSKEVDLILSSAKEGTELAKQHYSRYAREICLYRNTYPAINDAAALFSKGGVKDNIAVMFCRFSFSEHKGVDRIVDLLSVFPSKWKKILVVGTGDLPGKVREMLEDEGISNFELKKSVSDQEKFALLKQSRVLLFPSFFEGFGYPPIEALYCGVNVVAFDLPVLRETCGDRLFFAPLGDWKIFKKMIKKAVRAKPPRLDSEISEIGSVDRYSRELGTIFKELVDE